RESPSSRPGSLRHAIQCVVAVGTFALLAACGGGGGGGGGNDPPAPPATNAPPTVNAGDDTTATLPNATVALSGSATDDGPASSLTYAWSADPATVTFSAPSAAATNATFAAAGSYTLRLTVNDGSQSVSDTLVVTVSDTPPTGADVFPTADTDQDDLHGWTKVANAAEVGMTQGGLDDATAYATTVPTGVEPGAGMIVRHGKLVHSWGDIDQKRGVKSVTKSMGGIVLGLAI